MKKSGVATLLERLMPRGVDREENRDGYAALLGRRCRRHELHDLRGLGLEQLTGLVAADADPAVGDAGTVFDRGALTGRQNDVVERTNLDALSARASIDRIVNVKLEHASLHLLPQEKAGALNPGDRTSFRQQ